MLTVDWHAPKNVHATCSLRSGGVSQAPYAALNLGEHVGDAAEHVVSNRRIFTELAGAPQEPRWLEQVHGTAVVNLDTCSLARPRADAAISRTAGTVCAVQVADCLPVLFATRDGTAVAAAHAGWRGLLHGVLEQTVAALAAAPENILAWLGPAISAKHFEVGDEVRELFLSHNRTAEVCFTRNTRNRWQCDLSQLARQRLTACGITQISGGQWCTYSDAMRFYSYRRDGQTGRMAAAVWLSESI